MVSSAVGPDPSVGGSESKLTFADLELDEDTRQVRRGGRLIELTPTEHRLLRYLLANAGRVLTRDEILEAVWGYPSAGNASVLETYISYLRQKVEHRARVHPHGPRGRVRPPPPAVARRSTGRCGSPASTLQVL